MVRRRRTGVVFLAVLRGSFSAVPRVKAWQSWVNGQRGQLGLRGEADGGAEFHEGLVVVAGAVDWEEGFGHKPKVLLGFALLMGAWRSARRR